MESKTVREWGRFLLDWERKKKQEGMMFVFSRLKGLPVFIRKWTQKTLIQR